MSRNSLPILALVAAWVSISPVGASDTEPAHFNLWLNAIEAPECHVDEEYLRLFSKNEASQMQEIELHLSWNDDRPIIMIDIYTKLYETIFREQFCLIAMYFSARKVEVIEGRRKTIALFDMPLALETVSVDSEKLRTLLSTYLNVYLHQFVELWKRLD